MVHIQFKPLIGIAGSVVALLLCTGIAQKPGAASADAAIILEVPASIDLKVIAPTVNYDQATKESTFSGPATLTWPNGARLVVPSGEVTLQKRNPNEPQVIRIRTARQMEK